MVDRETAFQRAASVEQVRAAGCLTTQLDGHSVALFAYDNQVFAVDNRCPHMGFPLDRGTVRDGILTCHWHHARFDLCSGGTFDPWADDVHSFPVEIRDGQVWVDLGVQGDSRQHHQERLQVGLQRDLPLVIGKSVLALADGQGEPHAPLRVGLEFGTRYRRAGWGQGLTILTCLTNLLPYLDPSDRPRALYHGLSAVAENSSGSAPRFPILPLPGPMPGLATLKSWFRSFIEVRDAEGAERCVVSALRAGASGQELADMLFVAATDHRYIQAGHVLDFTNKAFEALDIAGRELAGPVLTSLVNAYAGADRMEEANSWRNPVDLVAILEAAFDQLPEAVEVGQDYKGQALAAENPGRENGSGWNFESELVQVLLGDDPQAIADALLAVLRAGVRPVDLAAAVSYTAGLRIARFHTSNEFSDWDTALHTFTFANAVEQGMRRAPSTELLRGVFDAAMSVYLDRFLNIPAARLPMPPQSGEARGRQEPPAKIDTALQELVELLEKQQQVNPAGQLVAGYLYAGGAPERMQATLGRLLLREDRDFHTIQTVEAAFRQYRMQRDPQAKVHMLVAAARYLAAHSPTVRSQGQTYEIAYRLHRGEKIYEGDG